MTATFWSPEPVVSFGHLSVYKLSRVALLCIDENVAATAQVIWLAHTKGTGLSAEVRFSDEV